MQPALRLLPAALLTLCSTSLFAAFRLTPEQPIAPPVITSQEQRTVPATATASDGDSFMVFWGGPLGVNATHVTAEGSVVGSPNVAIRVSPRSQDGDSSVAAIAACWTGSSYVVTWAQSDGGVYAAAFSRDGNLTSPARLITPGATIAARSLATNGRRVLMTYGLLNQQSVLARAAVLDSDAHLVAMDLPVPGGSTVAGLPAVASDGNDFALVYRAAGAIHLLRVTETATAIGNGIDLPGTGSVGDFDVAFARGAWVFAGLESTRLEGGDWQRYVRRLVVQTPSGAVTSLPAIDAGRATSVVSPAVFAMNVFWNGARFVACWMESDLSYYKLNRVAFSGVPEGAAPKRAIAAARTSYRANDLFLAFNGSDALAWWIESPEPVFGDFRNPIIVGQRFDPDVTMAIGSRVLVSIGWSRQLAPAVASSGADSLVVWVDTQGTYAPGDILAMRLAANGDGIDPTPIRISSSSRAERPAVAFNGTSYIVVWSDSRPLSGGPHEIVGRTVAHDGSLGPPVLLGNGWAPAVASNPATTLVVWLDPNVGTAGRRLDSRGDPIDTEPIAMGDGWYTGPSVATNGTDFFVAWNRAKFFSPQSYDLHVLGARVSANGAADAMPIEIATGSGDYKPAVASDGRDYVVIYTRGDTIGWMLVAKRVSREGQLAGSVAADPGTSIAPLVNYQETNGYASIVRNDTGFWIGWIAYKAPAMIVRTDGNGEPVDVPVSLGDTPLSSIALAEAPGGRAEIVSAHRVSEGTYEGTSRVFARFAGPAAVRSRAVRR